MQINAAAAVAAQKIGYKGLLAIFGEVPS